MTKINDAIEILPAEDAKLIRASRAFGIEKSGRGKNISDWLDILESYSRSILVIDNMKLSQMTGRELYDLVNKLPAILDDAGHSMPWVVRISSKTRGRIDLTFLEWFSTRITSLYSGKDIHSQLAERMVAEKYLELISRMIDDRSVDDRILITHFFSLTQYFSTEVGSASANYILLLEFVRREFERLSVFRPSMLANLIHFIFARQKVAGGEELAKEVSELIDLMNKKASEDLTIFQYKVSPVVHLSVFDHLVDVIHDDGFKGERLIDVVPILWRFVADNCPVKARLTEPESLLLDALSARDWISMLLYPIKLHNDNESIQFLLVDESENEAYVHRTERAVALLSRQEREYVVRSAFNAMQRAHSFTIKRADWERLLNALESGGIATGLDYRPRLSDLMAISSKHDEELIPVLKDRVSSDVFHVTMSELEDIIKDQRPNTYKAESLSLGFQETILFNLNIAQETSEVTLAPMLAYLLETKATVRNFLAPSMRRALGVSGFQELDIKAIESKITTKSDVVYLTKKLGLEPYRIMSVTEKDSIVSYCMELMAKL